MSRQHKEDKFREVDQALDFARSHPVSNMILDTGDSVTEVCHSYIRVRTGHETNNPRDYQYSKDIPADDLNRVCVSMLQMFQRDFKDKDVAGSYEIAFNTHSPFADRG